MLYDKKDQLGLCFAGLVLEPLPTGAWCFLSVTFTILTKTLTFQQAFTAFTNDVIWLIVVSFFFAAVSSAEHISNSSYTLTASKAWPAAHDGRHLHILRLYLADLVRDISVLIAGLSEDWARWKGCYHLCEGFWQKHTRAFIWSQCSWGFDCSSYAIYHSPSGRHLHAHHQLSSSSLR